MKFETLDHALNCPTGGFPTATLMSEVCHDVCVEPPLQPQHLSYATAIREDSAHLDVKARGFWGLRQQCAFFDARVFNPTAPSCQGLQMAACCRCHEGEKCCAYEQCIQEVEHGSLVFSTSGGMRRAATVAYKRLATLIAAKREQPYCGKALHPK